MIKQAAGITVDIFGHNRIIILGNNGSGKSFLGKELAAITGLPLVHLDAEFWLPNWETPSKEEWLRKNTAFISKEKWIIDGMCSHGGQWICGLKRRFFEKYVSIHLMWRR